MSNCGSLQILISTFNWLAILLCCLINTVWRAVTPGRILISSEPEMAHLPWMAWHLTLASVGGSSPTLPAVLNSPEMSIIPCRTKKHTISEGTQLPGSLLVRSVDERAVQEGRGQVSLLPRSKCTGISRSDQGTGTGDTRKAISIGWIGRGNINGITGWVVEAGLTAGERTDNS